MKIKKSRLEQIVNEEIQRFKLINKTMKKSLNETDWRDVSSSGYHQSQADAGPWAPEKGKEDPSSGLPMGMDQEATGGNPEVAAETAMAAAVDANDQAAFYKAVDDLIALDYTMEEIEEIVSSLGDRP